MTIEELYQLQEGRKVQFDALVADKKTLTTKAKKPYIQLSVQDATGTLEFPIWDNYESNNTNIEIEGLVAIEGKIGYYDGNLQIQEPKVTPINIGAINYNLFVPSYTIPENIFTYFNQTVEAMDHKYKQLAMSLTGCLGYDKKLWAEFTTCVSAVKHHGNKRGGLLLHVVGMMRTVDAMIANYIEHPHYYDAKDVIDPSRLRFKVIAHDIGKLKEYSYKGVIKHNNRRINHLTDSVIMVHKANDERGGLLTQEEMDDISAAIESHHGQWGKREPETLEDWLLHIADLTDARIVGAVEDKKK